MNAPTTISQQAATSPSDVTQALGALLSKARQARGLERQEVALRLGLSQEIIRALEEGNAQQVDAPVFVRGYLLRYARFLGLPEQEILERYRNLGISEQPPLQIAPVRPAKTGSHALLRGITYVLLAALLGWFVWLGYEQVPAWRDQAGSDTARPPTAASSTPGVPAPNTGHPGTVPSEHGGQPPAATTPINPVPAPAPAEPTPGNNGAGSVESQTAGITPPAAESTPAAGAQTPTGAAPPASLPPGHAELTLNFKGDCWVSIKDANGQRLAYGVMKANTSNTFTGSAPFRLVLGNSSAVELKLNGRLVDPATYVKRGGPSQLVLNLPLKPGP
ncbi:MAG: RodZ family helix-turn-helix domain-containing protein [Candidatus Competibacteraceae bacterium]